jgi:hypothetical protein
VLDGSAWSGTGERTLEKEKERLAKEAACNAETPEAFERSLSRTRSWARNPADESSSRLEDMAVDLSRTSCRGASIIAIAATRHRLKSVNLWNGDFPLIPPPPNTPASTASSAQSSSPSSPISNGRDRLPSLAESPVESEPVDATSSAPAHAPPPEKDEGLVSSIARLFGGAGKRRGRDFELGKPGPVSV